MKKVLINTMKKVLISAVIVLIGLFVMYSASDSALLEKFQDNLNAILSLGYEVSIDRFFNALM